MLESMGLQRVGHNLVTKQQMRGKFINIKSSTFICCQSQRIPLLFVLFAFVFYELNKKSN